jgi:hypothetical protein
MDTEGHVLSTKAALPSPGKATTEDGQKESRALLGMSKLGHRLLLQAPDVTAATLGGAVSPSWARMATLDRRITCIDSPAHSGQHFE